MTKINNIKVVLESIQYDGANIGRELKFDFTIGEHAGSKVLLTTQIPHGTTKSFNKVIAERQVIAKKKTLLKIAIAGQETDVISDAVSKQLAPFNLCIPNVPASQVFNLDIIAVGGDEGRVGKFKITIRYELFGIKNEGEGGDENEEGGTPENPKEQLPPSLIELLENPANSRIIAAVSDLHIGAEKFGDDFDTEDDEAFEKFIDWLKMIKNRKAKGVTQSREIDLVLLGDVVELWEATPALAVFTPDLNEAQKNELRATRGKDLKKILKRITAKHKLVFDSLLGFIAEDKNRVIYVRGNHDDEIIAEKPRAVDSKVEGGAIFREVLKEEYSSQKNDLDKKFRFRDFYSNSKFRVTAQHGHNFDDFNNSDHPTEDKPGGRYVVENLVKPAERFLVNGKPLLEIIDSYTPLEKLLEHINCLKEKGALKDSDLKTLNTYTARLVRTLNLRGKAGLSDALKKKVDALLRLKQDLDINIFRIEFIILGMKSMSRNGAAPTAENAKSTLTNTFGTDDQCSLMGHNHKAVLQKLGADELYINTGTWQDILNHNPKNPCIPIPGPNRHISLLVLQEPPKGKKVVHAFQFVLGENQPLLTAKDSYTVK